MRTFIGKQAWGRKLLAIALTVAMVFGIVPTLAPMTAYATTDNFEIDGGGTYETLAEAVDAVPTNGTITLLQDVTVSGVITLNAEKTYTVDFGEKTLTCTRLSVTKGTLTLRNGGITGTYSSEAINVSNCTITISDLEVTGLGDAILCGPGNKTTIVSGHFVATNDKGDGAIYRQGGQIILAQGSTANKEPWMNSAGAADVTVTAGDPSNPDTTAPTLSNGSIDRTGHLAATIGFSTDEAGTAYYFVVDKDDEEPSGATVKAKNNSLGSVSGTVSGKAVTLSAGAKDIYVVVEDAWNNISEPLKIAAAAYIPPSGDNFQITGGGTFDSLRDAIIAVPNNGTITMLKDVTVGVTENVNINLTTSITYTIDLGGYILSGRVQLQLNSGSTVTIQNGSVISSRDVAIQTSGNGTLNILSGYYEGDDDAVYCISNSKVNITAGHFVAKNDYGDGCLVTNGSAQINLANGSVASVENWKNGASEVTVYIPTTVTVTGLTATKTYDGTTRQHSQAHPRFPAWLPAIR
jgi:hypothetical protein